MWGRGVVSSVITRGDPGLEGEANDADFKCGKGEAHVSHRRVNATALPYPTGVGRVFGHAYSCPAPSEEGVDLEKDRSAKVLCRPRFLAATTRTLGCQRAKPFSLPNGTSALKEKERGT